MNYLKFILILLLPCTFYSQQNVDINEPFEGSWMPVGWQSSQFSQSTFANNTPGGSRSAAHGISVFSTASITSTKFHVLPSEQFDTISFWYRHSAISVVGTMSIDVIGSSGTQQLSLVNLGLLPSNTWVKHSYSYTASADDSVSVRISFSHSLTVGSIFIDDIKIHKSVVMPVNLSYFNYLCRENNVTLNWGTSGEINNHGFEVYRSTDNNSWRKTGFVPGKGTTNEPQQYSYADTRLNTGKYLYRIKQVDYNGSYEYFALSDAVMISSPKNFALEQNYPNPSNPTTTIGYRIPNDAAVKIVVYDISGREVKTLVNTYQTAGYYKAEFNGSAHSSGVYIYKITAGEYTSIKKMILIK